MTAEMISLMIQRVANMRISTHEVKMTAKELGCQGSLGARGTYYASNDIQVILMYFGLNPAAFVGKG